MSRKAKPQSLPEQKNKRFWPVFFKFCAAGIVLVAIYAVYLSAQMANQFDGPKWQVPAQLFARPLDFYVGKSLAKSELVKELKLLGYREVKRLNKTGEFRYIRNGIEVYRRSFQFVDGPSPAQKIQLMFQLDKISQIKSLADNTVLGHARLEPLLIDRLLSSQLEDRILVTLDEVPQAMIDALLQVEDRDFFQHAGVKPTAIIRALIANLKAGRTVQGGSTLTQQLVKNHFLSRERSIVRKINEAIMSVLIELNYSKHEILQAYLNEVYLGQHGNRAIHGFGLAAYFYFAKPLNELELDELALLVGMIKGPSYYNPRRYPERAKKRRDLVLKLMADQQLAEPQTIAKLQQKPIRLVDKDRAIRGRHPSFMQMVKRELKQVVDNPSLIHAGLRVFTTMDPVAQRNAEKAVVRGLKRLEQRQGVNDLQAAMIVSDKETAEIKVLVGDRNIDYLGFNRALDMKRPVGSLLKPAVYLTALEQSETFNLASRIADQPIKIADKDGQLWQPNNADKKFRGEVSLLEGLVNSLNVPAVNLGIEVGIADIHYTLNRLGIDQPLPDYPSMILGSVGISAKSINQAYQTMANNGVYQKLHSVMAVADNRGQLIYQATKNGQARTNAKATYLLNYAMHQVTKKGTAKKLSQSFKGVNFAAKTGTTDDYRDSWFSGYDRTSVATIWVGRDDNKPMLLSGASGAMSLFIDYHKLGHPYSLTSPMPNGVEIALFDQKSGYHVKAGCRNGISLPAIVDTLPAPARCSSRNKPTQSKDKKPWWKRIFG